ncbi:MAG: hypothetical protein ABIT76_01385 [Chthoniobacterales bacterium]
MKSLSFCLASLWFFTVAALAQDVPPAATPTPLPAGAATSQSVFLDVKDLGTNVSSSENWRSVWGSYSKNVTRARALEIVLRNPAKLPGEFVVEWYFFAIPARGGKRFLSGRDTKTIQMAPGGTEKATVVSDALDSTTAHYSGDYYYYNSSYKTGSKPEGWIVTISTGGKMIRLKSSSAQLEEIYKKTDDFKVLLEGKRKTY